MCVAFALLDAAKSLEIGANATELPFCSIHHRIAWSIHASSTPANTPETYTNPLKPMIHTLHAYILTNTENP